MGSEQKNALVTGGGRGIGLAIVQELARAGMRVLLNDTGFSIDGRPEDPELSTRVSEELSRGGLSVVGSRANAATPEGARALIAEAGSRLGQVDILVNNAAILQDRMVFNLDPTSWDRVIANNLSAQFYLTHMVSQGMRTRMWGRVINMVSSAGLIGNRGQANYGSAKGGLVSLSRIAALDLARYGVTVNAITPFAHTRVTETIPPTTPWLVDYLATVKGVASPQSVALLARYLCSERAKVVTGQVFGVRGSEFFLFTQPRPIGVRSTERNATPDEDFLDHAFASWESEGLFTPLETDLMVMSRKFNQPEVPKPVRR